MTSAQVQQWLDAYVAAWRSYDRAAIGDLFSENATYAYHPWDEPLRGRAAIIESWLADQDAPDSWEARYAPLLLADDRVIATGETSYTDGTRYSNLWVMRFDVDGRCSDYVEWFIEQLPR